MGHPPPQKKKIYVFLTKIKNNGGEGHPFPPQKKKKG